MKRKRVGLRRARRGVMVLRSGAMAAAAVGLVLGALEASAPSALAAPYRPVTNYAAYVGGHGKANPKLSPIVVGVVNEQGGTEAVAPEWTTGAQIAVKYINQHAGGIDGHPLQIKTCFIPDTVSSAAQCGQEFANNKAISAISAGAIFIGNQAMESALLPTKKPIIFGVSLSPVDTKYPYGYILYGDVAHVQAPIATFVVKYLHAKSVSISYPNIPAEQTAASIVKQALNFAGVKNVYSVGFDPSETDLTAPFEAAHVGSTSVLLALNSGGPACSDTYLTLKQLGIHTKVLANVPCVTPAIAKADGGQLPPGWYYASANPLPGDKSDPSIAAFQAVATEYGQAPLGADAWTADSFGQMVTIARFYTQILKAHRTITPATVNAQARAFKGPVVQGAPNLNCGGYKGAPAVCNDKVSFFQNIAPGVMKPIVYYLGPPKGFTVTG
jgi:branched-chain amino acid transport system substrate-binding protein